MFQNFIYLFIYCNHNKYLPIIYLNLFTSSFLSFHQESCPSNRALPMPAEPMAMPLAVVRSWGEQTVSSWGRPVGVACMVCLMPQSHVSYSLENPHFNTFTIIIMIAFITRHTPGLKTCSEALTNSSVLPRFSKGQGAI